MREQLQQQAPEWSIPPCERHFSRPSEAIIRPWHGTGIDVASPRRSAPRRNWPRRWPSWPRRREGRRPSATVADRSPMPRARVGQGGLRRARRPLREGATSALMRRHRISRHARRRRLKRRVRLRLSHPKLRFAANQLELPRPAERRKLRSPANRLDLDPGDRPSPTARRRSSNHRRRRTGDALVASSSVPRWWRRRAHVWATDPGRPRASRVFRTQHRPAPAFAAGPRVRRGNADGWRWEEPVCSATARGDFGGRGRETPGPTPGRAGCAACTRRCC